MPSKVSIAVVFILSIWGATPLSAQDAKLAIKEDILSFLPQGEHAFDLIKNRTVARIDQPEISTDNYGKKPLPPAIFLEEPEAPLLDFQSVNTLYLKVLHSQTELQLTASRNSFFPTIRIDLNSDRLYLEDHALIFDQAVEVTNQKNFLGSSWKGYRWKSECGDESREFQCRFTLGQLESDGRIYIDIRWLVNGKGFHYRLLG